MDRALLLVCGGLLRVCVLFPIVLGGVVCNSVFFDLCVIRVVGPVVLLIRSFYMYAKNSQIGMAIMLTSEVI